MIVHLGFGPRVNVRPLQSFFLAICTLALLSPLAVGVSNVAADPIDEFQTVDVITGLDRPVALEFAPNGDAFVIEKNGRLLVFEGLGNSPAVVLEWFDRVFPNGDRGMLGLAIDPGYGTGSNYVYLFYTLDELPGGSNPPYWNDQCPPQTSDGCLVTATLSRVEIDPVTHTLIGTEQVLINDGLCLQFLSHSNGDLTFGPDGYLYVSAGDGASFDIADYGQLGGNPCQDPPYPAQPTPQNGEGGALRSQDLLTSVGGELNDPVLLHGTVLRIDPATGQAAPGNPLEAVGVVSDDRMIAHGLRNPYRFAFRPGTDELWVGDVGWGAWEEINVIADVNDAVVENFGWPCYEGPNPHGTYSQYGLCQKLINNPSSLFLQTTLTQGHYSYLHGQPVDGCDGVASAITGVAFAQGAPYPPSYDGALFFADFARQCLWAMKTDAGGVPDPGQIELIADSVGAIDLVIAPNGSLLIVDPGNFANGSGKVRRLEYIGANQPPSAQISVNTLSGTFDVTDFMFDGSGSSDPENQALTYEWDLDGDGSFDETGPTASKIYPAPGTYLVKLRVTDSGGASNDATVSIDVSNTPPTATVSAPVATMTFDAGDLVSFAGSGDDAEDGTLSPGTPGSEWEWLLIQHHCPAFECHSHVQNSWTGVASGSFTAPDHEYPSYLELVLTVQDSTGTSGSDSVEIQPNTSTVTLESNIAGIKLYGGNGAQQGPWPVIFEAIQHGELTVGAPSPQTVGGFTYAFDSWSDGGGQIHDIGVPVDDLTLTANFALYDPPAPDVSFSGSFMGVTPAAGWSYLWNETSALGDPAGYVPLLWSGGFYDSDGIAGHPDSTEMPYGLVTTWGATPGLGSSQGAANERYAILRHTVPKSGPYSIVGSTIADTDCTSNGVELTVLVNNSVVSTTTHQGTTASTFDQSLGDLIAGDTIDVALGPDGSDACDSTLLDYIITQATGVVPPLSIIDPGCLVYDSISSGDGAISPGSTLIVNVAGASACVPAGASSVVLSASAQLPQGVGNLRVSAAGTMASGGVLNYAANGLHNSNTVTVPLSLAGNIQVQANNAATDVRFVAVGYYSDAGTLSYFPVTPCAAADSRDGTNSFAGLFAAGDPYPDVDVVGDFNLLGDNQGGGQTNCGVPEDATAVMVNVVSVQGDGGAGGIAVGVGGSEPSEPITNFSSVALNNAATALIPVDGFGKIAANITSSAGAPETHVRLVVMGYYKTTGGAEYEPVTPCAAFDSRTDVAGDSNVPTGIFAEKRIAGTASVNMTGTTTYNVTGLVPAAQGGQLDCGVPEGATAVLINLVAIQPDSAGNFRAFANGSSPTGGVLNFALVTPEVNNSNAVVVPLSSLGDMDLFVNSPSRDGDPIVHARGVILGYFI